MEKATNDQNKEADKSVLTPAQKACKLFYEQYVQDTRQNILSEYGYQNQEELLKSILFGNTPSAKAEEINNRLKPTLITLPEFASYYISNELLPDTKLKEKYTEVISVGRHNGLNDYGYPAAAKALPNGDIISSGHGKIYRWKKIDDGEYKKMLIDNHEGSIDAAKVLPNGEIVSGGNDEIYRLEKLDNGKYKKVPLGENDYYRYTRSQVLLLNGDIVSAGDIVYDGDFYRIYRWKKLDDGNYEKKLVGEHEGKVISVKALPNGDIISSGEGITHLGDDANGFTEDGGVYRWKKLDNDKYEKIPINKYKGNFCIEQILPDGNLVIASEYGTIQIWK